jgi:hypothetical protein
MKNMYATYSRCHRTQVSQNVCLAVVLAAMLNTTQSSAQEVLLRIRASHCHRLNERCSVFWNGRFDGYGICRRWISRTNPDAGSPRLYCSYSIFTGTEFDAGVADAAVVDAVVVDVVDAARTPVTAAMHPDVRAVVAPPVRFGCTAVPITPHLPHGCCVGIALLVLRRRQRRAMPQERFAAND